jgi:hypothetical protein
MANRSPVPLPEHTRFKPGQSGNLRGRPKDNAHIRALARAHAEGAILTLVEIMNNPKAKASAQIAAACAILDRALGKPGRAVMYEDDEPAQYEFVVSFADTFTRKVTDLAARTESEEQCGALHLQLKQEQLDARQALPQRR